MRGAPLKGRRHDQTGRSTGVLKSKRHSSIDGQYVAHRLAMLEHPAFHALSFVARRILDRIEIEHCHTGGNENGNLIVTYSDFERFGIRRKSVTAAIAELVAFGFLEVVERGRPSAMEYRTPSKYRLTYFHTATRGPTDEWARLSEDDARQIAAASRDVKKRPSGQDIDSRGINAPSPVVAETPPNTGRSGGENAPSSRAKMPLAFANGVGR